MGGIYTITNSVNGKIYIGCTKDFEIRCYTHFNNLKNNKHSNEHLQNSFNKYGKNNFNFEILEECDELLLTSQENYWCNMLNTHDKKYGYNIKPTSPDYNGKISNETKLKISKSNSGKKRTQETINKLKIAKKNISNETRLKMSSSQKNKKVSDKTKKLISIASKKRKVTKESIEKMVNAIRGKKLSKEHIEKLRLAKLGKKWSKERVNRMKEIIIQRKGTNG
jgi:group I intron endonuclease